MTRWCFSSVSMMVMWAQARFKTVKTHECWLSVCWLSVGCGRTSFQSFPTCWVVSTTDPQYILKLNPGNLICPRFIEIWVYTYTYTWHKDLPTKHLHHSCYTAQSTDKEAKATWNLQRTGTLSLSLYTKAFRITMHCEMHAKIYSKRHTCVGMTHLVGTC